MVTKITIDDTEYTLAPIRAGQMRDMEKARKDNPSSTFMDDNMALVAYCMTNGGVVTSPTQIEEMPYPVYRKLLDAAQEISGFTEKKPGENQAV